MAEPLSRHLSVSWESPDKAPTVRSADDPTRGAHPTEFSRIRAGPPADWYDRNRDPYSAVLPLRITACPLPRPDCPHGDRCPTAEPDPLSRFLRPAGLLSGLNFLEGLSAYRQVPVCAGTPLSRGEGHLSALGKFSVGRFGRHAARTRPQQAMREG